MAFKKVYIPIAPLKEHKDFDVWYEDGMQFMHVQSDWESEKSRIAIMSRHNAEMASIKPDNKALCYDIRVERYTYTLHTYTIFEHYYIEGMLWQMHGTLAKNHVHFESEATNKNEVLVTVVKFEDKGPCYEVKVKEISHLRIAAACIIAIANKEAWKGLSEGEKDDSLPWYKKVSRYFLEPGMTYEQVLAAKENKE